MRRSPRPLCFRGCFVVSDRRCTRSSPIRSRSCQDVFLKMRLLTYRLVRADLAAFRRQSMSCQALTMSASWWTVSCRLLLICPQLWTLATILSTTSKSAPMKPTNNIFPHSQLLIMSKLRPKLLRRQPHQLRRWFLNLRRRHPSQRARPCHLQNPIATRFRSTSSTLTRPRIRRHTSMQSTQLRDYQIPLLYQAS